MRVTIVDLDWYNKTAFVPNPVCMKISTYFKCLNYTVNFATTKYELLFAYDEMYVIRESLYGSLPDEIHIRDKNVHLIGKGFRFYAQYMPTINNIIAACRPDYNLYNLPEENKFTKSDFVQFFGNDGKLLPLRQDYHNTYKATHTTAVSDVDFWNHDDDDLEQCVKKLKHEENVVYLNKISLKALLNDPRKQALFWSIHYKSHSVFRFESDFDPADNDKAIKFLEDFRTNVTMTVVPTIYFRTFFPEYDTITNIRNALQLACRAKRKKIHIVLQAPNRLECTMWDYYEDLEAWSRNFFEYAYVQNAATVDGFAHGVTAEQVLTNTIYWTSPVIENMMFIYLRDKKVIEDYGFVQWGERDYPFVDLQSVIKGNKII